MQQILGPYRLVALLICLTIGLAGCDSSSGPDNPSGNQADNPDPATAVAAGNAQKGPFQPGGTAAAFQLQADGSRDDASVSGDITANGGFRLADIDWTGPSELTMSGTYFDEFTGNFSMGANGNATLNGVIALPGDVNANVNLFTHFVAARIKQLMADSAAFNDARNRARNELATIMGISAVPSSLNLLQDNGDSAHQSDSANLLLFSAAALAAGTDQADIDAMAADFADDGDINGAGQDAFDDIQQAARNNPGLLDTARTNLQNQYGVTPPDNTSGESPAWTPGAPVEPAAPVAELTTSGPLQAGETQSFDASSSTGDNLSYAWDFGDGDTATGPQTTHSFANAGTYSVELMVTDDAERSATDSRNLTITDAETPPDPPSARISVDGGDDNGRGFLERAVELDARDSRGANLTYTWDFDDGTTASGAVVEHTYTAVGDYNPVVTVEDSAGQTDRRSALVTIGTRRLVLDGQKVTGNGALEENPLNSQDFFGTSVALDGDTAVVGARGGNITDPADNRDGFTYSRGAAFVYSRAGDGTWVEQPVLTAGDDNEQIREEFGRAVTVTGDTIVIGAPGRDVETDDGTNSNQGAAYVFSLSAGGSSAPTQLTVSDGQANDEFGRSVASDAGTIMIGSNNAVYVYTPGSGLVKLTASDGGEAGVFGASIAIEGDIALIGAPDGGFVQSGPGAAYVFARVNGTWSQTAKLTPSDGESGDDFGTSVAVAGNTIMVASADAEITRSNGGTRHQGAVYVYNRSGSAWIEQDKLTAADGRTFDRFSTSIALVGDTALFGTSRSGVGTGYVFTRTNGTWSEQANFISNDDVADDGFGFVLAADGDHTLVGAPGGGGDRSEGAAFFYNTSDLEQ